MTLLKFHLHISDMCKRVSRQINALERISKFLTPDSCKSIYRTFITASFNHCPISWIFCGKKITSKLEKLQECALRLVFCDQTATYDDLLKRGNFLSLKAFRNRCPAVEAYKCIHGLNPMYLNALFTEPLANYNFRDKCHLHQPQFHTYTYGFRSFKYSGSKLWNSLPHAIKNKNNINEFKKILQSGVRLVISPNWRYSDLLFHFKFKHLQCIPLSHLRAYYINTECVCYIPIVSYIFDSAQVLSTDRSILFIYLCVCIVFNFDFCMYSTCAWILTQLWMIDM